MESKIFLIENIEKWRASHNGVSVDASIQIRVHRVDSDTVVLIVPGVDGSVDGYENKYVDMANRIVEKHNKSVVRISNDFISSFHWEDNFRKAVEYINNNSKKLFKRDNVNIEVIAHSAGASVAAWLAHEYSNITKLLLINTAIELEQDKIIDGINKCICKVYFVFGELDPSVKYEHILPDKANVTFIKGADHYFSGKYLSNFIALPDLLADKN